MASNRNSNSNSNSDKRQATATATGEPKLDISGTPIAQGPKLRPKGPLPKALLFTEFRVKTHQGAGSMGKKVFKIREIRKSEARAGGTGVGDHFGTLPPISVTIDGASPKLLW